MKATQNCFKKKGIGKELGKNNIDGMNLIKIHYMHNVNTTMKPLYTINLY
jgi:hypothetical protein